MFTFKSTDVVNYPEGDYTIRITGTAGTTTQDSDFYDFTFKLVNPCKTLTLGHPASSGFTNIVYSLGQAALETMNWDPDTIVT